MKDITIHFTHLDGTRHTFRSLINPLTGDRLTSFDNKTPSVNDSKAYVDSVVRDLNARNAEVALNESQRTNTDAKQ